MVSVCICKIRTTCIQRGASQVVLVVKKLPVNDGDNRDAGLIPGWGRSPGGGHSYPRQYSCLENFINRGSWWAIVQEVTKSQTLLKRLSLHVFKEISSVNE